MNTHSDSFDEPKRKLKLPLWTIISGVILAVIVGASFIIPQFLDQSKYKSLIQQKVKEASGYDVDWQGNIGIIILPLPQVTMNDVVVKNGAHEFLKVGKAQVRVALTPLFNKSVEVQSILLKDSVVQLVTDAQGVNLWQAQKPVGVVQDTNAANVTQSSPAAAVKIGAVSIENAQVTIENQQKNTKQSISNLNTDIKMESLDGPFDIAGDAVWNKLDTKFDISISALPKDQKPIDIKGVVELPKANIKATINQSIAMGDIINTKGDLDLQIADIAKASQALTGKETKLPKGIGPKLSLQSNIMFNGDEFSANNLSLKTGVLDYVGSVKLTELKSGASPLVTLNLQSRTKDASNVDLPVKILADLSANASARFANNVLTIQTASIALDGQAVNIAGSIRLPKDKQKIGLNVAISSPRLDLDDLQKQYIAPTESAAQKASNDNKSKVVGVTGFALPFEGNVKSDIKSLNIGGREFSNMVVDVTAKDASAQITKLSFTAFADTSLMISGAIADTTKLSGLNLSVNAKTGNAEQLASSFGATLPKLPKPLGAVGLNGRFTGSLEQLGFDATTSVWGFQASGKGNVGDVMVAPKIQQLSAKLSHGNVADAIGIFAKGFAPPKSFRGAMNLSSNISWDKDQYRLAGLTGKIGSTSVNGGLTFSNSGKPSLNGSLILGAVELDSSAPTSSAATAVGGTTSAKPSGSARWSREAINVGWMRNFNADLAVQAQSLTQGEWRFDNPKFSFVLNDGTLSLRDLSANMFGGSASLNGTVKAGASDRDPLSIAGNLSAKNIRAEKLHSAVANAQKNTFQGLINNFDVKVNAVGLSPAALIQSLSGNGNLNGQNIIVNGVDAGKLAEAARGSFKPLERAGSLYGSFQAGSTKFDTMKVGFDISSGIVNFNQINLNGPTAAIDSTGNLNLPRWTIDLSNKMTVKNTDIPPFEFKIAGPLDSPIQTGGSIIENYLKQRAQKKVEKLITKELEKRLGGDVGGALGGLLGIKKQEQPAAAPAPVETAPEPNTEPASTPSAPVPAATPDDAVNNIISDPKNIKTEDAVKALEGLFGQ
jgi:uncharacterized protein involved in outer membrane biogenesis